MQQYQVATLASIIFKKLNHFHMHHQNITLENIYTQKDNNSKQCKSTNITFTLGLNFKLFKSVRELEL